MDDVLKRRMIGAAVLLAGAFVVASLLPDPGPQLPADRSGQSVTYDLRTGRALTDEPAPGPPHPAPRPMVTEEEATEDAQPAPEAPAPEKPAVKPAPKPADKVAKAPEATKRPALKVDEHLGGASAAAGAGDWYVQIGSFGNQQNARSVLTKLYGANLPAVIQTVPVDGKLWYRVRVGPYADETSTQRALAKIKQQGFPLAKVVKPG